MTRARQGVGNVVHSLSAPATPQYNGAQKQRARRLNEELPAKVAERLRLSGARGRPYGTEGWMARIVKRLGLGHTVRDPWRPKKKGRAKRKEVD